MQKGWIAVVVLLMVASTWNDAAEARRFGGGRSFGAQRPSAAPPVTAPRTPPAAATPSSPGAAANPVMPAQSSAAAPRAGSPAAGAAAPARSGMSRWLAPVAGLAAGLGLAALLAHFGLSEAFASFLLLALLAIGVLLVVRALFMRRSSPGGVQYAGATTGAPFAGTRNEASWGRPERIEPALAATGSTGAQRVPPGFDVDGFLRNARSQFTAIQGAWDAGDRRTLANVTTPGMFDEIRRDLETRGAHQPTDIVGLETDLLEVTTEAGQHWASVRFFGQLREDGSPAAQPFDETWNLTKPVDGSSGWLLAGIQQNEPAVAVH